MSPSSDERLERAVVEGRPAAAGQLAVDNQLGEWPSHTHEEGGRPTRVLVGKSRRWTAALSLAGRPATRRGKNCRQGGACVQGRRGGRREATNAKGSPGCAQGDGGDDFRNGGPTTENRSSV
ncbi:hypothetical protein Salat_2609200 [Sesamum alatum]|uniref:Uncharacterized protein n=1 Tax=Sesamum alatum TaxID=300844 RepID=A0AAE1XPB5_9LAMI|nr:hypothetical protein Salat_2609200 [Sesamum alatum]